MTVSNKLSTRDQRLSSEENRNMSTNASKHIRVVARTRPTANFAKDVLQLEEDGKVAK